MKKLLYFLFGFLFYIPSICSASSFWSYCFPDYYTTASCQKSFLYHNHGAICGKNWCNYHHRVLLKKMGYLGYFRGNCLYDGSTYQEPDGVLMRFSKKFGAGGVGAGGLYGYLSSPFYLTFFEKNVGAGLTGGVVGVAGGLGLGALYIGYSNIKGKVRDVTQKHIPICQKNAIDFLIWGYVSFIRVFDGFRLKGMFGGNMVVYYKYKIDEKIKRDLIPVELIQIIKNYLMTGNHEWDRVNLIYGPYLEHRDEFGYTYYEKMPESITIKEEPVHGTAIR